MHELAQIVISFVLGIICGGGVAIAILSIAGLNLIILAGLLKKRTLVELSIGTIAFSFLIACAYESQRLNSSFWINCFCFGFFLLPIISFASQVKAGNLNAKSAFQPARTLEGAVIAALVPCLIGLFYTTLYFLRTVR